MIEVGQIVENAIIGIRGRVVTAERDGVVWVEPFGGPRNWPESQRWKVSNIRPVPQLEII